MASVEPVQEFLRGIQAVVFDVGETLIDETRLWGLWADWLGVPRLTLFGILGGVIERGEEHLRVFDILGFDFEAERRKRDAAGVRWQIERADFYPDAIPCLQALRSAGLRVGMAGNQPPAGEASLRALDLPVDFIGSSAAFGVEKPDPGFFRRIVDLAGVPAGSIAYVGDRVDNDVIPAADAGMAAVFIRRGPWGFAHQGRPGVERAAVRVSSLNELAGLIVG